MRKKLRRIAATQSSSIPPQQSGNSRPPSSHIPQEPLHAQSQPKQTSLSAPEEARLKEPEQEAHIEEDAQGDLELPQGHIEVGRVCYDGDRNVCYLSNPNPNAPFIGKEIPLPDPLRQQALGLMPQPSFQADAAPGDANAGNTYFRRGQFYAYLADNIAGNPAASSLEYSEPVFLATARTTDIRPRYFHVSFFQFGAIRSTVAPSPSLATDVLFNAIGQTPRVSALRGRVEIQDEGGNRFFDVDILGTRSMAVYAFSVSVSILLPVNPATGQILGFEVDRLNADSAATTLPAGLVEDSFCSARIVPTFQNASLLSTQVTRTVTVLQNGTASVRIPPGSRTVQIRDVSGGTALGAAYIIGFTQADAANVGAAGFTGVTMGRIFTQTGVPQTDRISVPNANFIFFSDAGNTGTRTFSLTFETDM